MSIIPKPFIASSVFVDTPTQTPGSFSNGISFADAVNSVTILQNKVLTLSSAQVRNLNSRPVVLVPAIPNASIEPISFSWKVNGGTIPYDVTDVDSIVVEYDGIYHFSDASLDPLTTASSKGFIFSRQTSVDAQSFNEGNDLYLLTLGADPTLGNSTVTVEVLYKVHYFA